MDPNTLLSDIMTPMPVTVDSRTSLPEISRIFEENSFHHLPVVDEAALVGIISRQDFLRFEHALSVDWSGRMQLPGTFQDFCASDFMTEYPLSLAPDDTVGLAADIFLSNKFHAVPIIEDDMLIGIVTAHDLIAYAYASPVKRGEFVDQ